MALIGVKPSLAGGDGRFPPVVEACRALAALVGLLNWSYCQLYTDKKEKKIFLIYKKIQKGAVAKLYITNDN